MNEPFDITKVAIIERHPWPTKSILSCTDFSSTEWGFLIIYKDPARSTGVGFYFDQTTSPSEDLVNIRWADRFKYNRKKLAKLT